MKKKNLKNLKLDKIKIVDFNQKYLIKGRGIFIESLNAPCDERDTFNTHCPEFSIVGNNC